MPVTAIYPGSFDPITKGHLDVVIRASRLFDHVIMAVANNSQKHQLFTVPERLKLIEESVSDLSNVSVKAFEGLTAEFAKKQGATVIIRGLRAISDFEYEFQLSQMNKMLYPDLEAVFVMASLDYTFLSSSMVKEVVTLGGDVSELVPECVQRALGKQPILPSSNQEVRVS